MTEGSFSAEKKERVAMKRRYQIEQQRAVQEFRRLAREENPNLQMIFPMTEVGGLLQEGVGHLMREAGLALMSLVMEEEVRHLAGERHEQHPARRAHRWGKESGYCVVDGQKVPIQRTRLRSPENREQQLGSYELFQRSGPMEHAVWDKMMRGLSTRNYGAVVKDFRRAGHAFAPRRIAEIVPGRVYVLSGFEFTEYYFVVSDDGRQLIGIDAGTSSGFRQGCVRGTASVRA
jgi:hypothetical protein